MDIYEDREELFDKILFYLGHDTLRQKIAKQGYELVQKEHTYLHRMKTFFDILHPYLQ